MPGLERLNEAVHYLNDHYNNAIQVVLGVAGTVHGLAFEQKTSFAVVAITAFSAVVNWHDKRENRKLKREEIESKKNGSKSTSD